MFSKKLLAAVTLILVVTLLYPGCAPKPEVKPQVTALSPATYKAVNMYRKDYLFDQPSSNKRTEKLTMVSAELTYRQEAINTDAQRNETDKITIEAVKLHTISSNTVQVDFDSTRGAEPNNALARLVGQTYTIKISPTGSVLEVSNVQAARDAVKSLPDARFAERLLSDESIKERHEILALPDMPLSKLKVHETWSKVVPTPKGTLLPKTFEKSYNVTKIDRTDAGRVALIEMNGTPTSKKAQGESPESSATEVFGNLFDSEDTYSGNLLVNIDTGKIRRYNEKFESRLTAIEMPKGNEQPQQQPDVLKLGFTQEHTIDTVE
jgi:hypothetical protein